jgi:hypothetical protein
VTFRNGNRGRLLSIEVHTDEQGDNIAASSVPLLGVAYDPPGKGNDFIVTTGREEEGYSHRIPAPTEVWEGQYDNGQVNTLEIRDHNHGKTVLSL